MWRRREGEVEEQADLYDALDCEPESRALQWRLGVDGELAIEERRAARPAVVGGTVV